MCERGIDDVNVVESVDFIMELHELTCNVVDSIEDGCIGMSPVYAIQMLMDLVEIIKPMLNECRWECFNQINDDINCMGQDSVEYANRRLKWMQSMLNMLDMIEVVQTMQ